MGKTPVKHKQYPVTIYPDGSITYWSITQALWVERARGIPKKDLAAMDPKDRERVIGALRSLNEGEQA